jgi:NAD(P)-dependent dehydrogenase (short-subunit alcohol dehydrogenase family)
MTNAIKKNWGEGDIADQTGKTVFITGANIGLGFEATRMLSSRGARVLMACRDPERAKGAAATLRAANPKAKLDLIALDLSDLGSVSGVDAQLKALGVSRLDVLINNAGVMMPPKRLLTRQGHELQFGTNHLGHFALTRALFGMLSPDARIVNVASIADRRGDINWADLKWEKSYNPSAAYGQSKTANLLFTFELARRLQAAKSGKMTAAAHPGIAMTNLATSSTIGRWLWLIRILMALGLGPKVQPPAMGALPEVYAATGEIEQGAYYGPEHRVYGHPVRAEAHRAAHSSDPKSAAKLWAISEELTGGTFTVS